MRFPLTLSAAALLALVASESVAQRPSAPLALRVSVVKSCGVTTNVSGNAPAQVTCSRGSNGNAPEAIMSLSSSDRAGSTMPQAMSSAPQAVSSTPQPIADSATGAAPAAGVAVDTSAETATDDTAWLTELPLDSVSAAAVMPRPVHQVVTINF